MDAKTRESKWQRVLDTYKRLIQGQDRRLILTDSQHDFVKAVNNKCFGRVYMHRPSDYMVNKLHTMTLDLVT